MFLLVQLQSKSSDSMPFSGIGLCVSIQMYAHTHAHVLPSVLTNRSGSLTDFPMIGGRVSVGVPVVMGDGHVIQPVVLWRERAWVRQAVRLVGEPIGWAETLCRTYGAGPLTGVNIWVQGTISLKAVLFGSGRDRESSLSLHLAPYVYSFFFQLSFHLFLMEMTSLAKIPSDTTLWKVSCFTLLAKFIEFFLFYSAFFY